MAKQPGKSARKGVMIDLVNDIKSSKITDGIHGVNHEADKVLGIVDPEKATATADPTDSATNGPIKITGFVAARDISKYFLFSLKRIDFKFLFLQIDANHLEVAAAVAATVVAADSISKEDKMIVVAVKFQIIRDKNLAETNPTGPAITGVHTDKVVILDKVC